MHAQLPSQQHLPHQSHPPSTQAQYATNGIYDNRSQQAAYANGHSNGVDMNPYQQYAGAYAQPQSYPPAAQQPQQQHPHQQHPQQQQQHPQQQHPQQQHPQQQQQPQQQPQQGAYMQPSQRLPPLGPGMLPGMPGMHNVRDEPSAPPASSANSQQPPQYSMVPPQPQSQPQMPYQPQPQQSLPPAPTPRAGASNQSGEKKMSHSGTRNGYKYSLQVVQQPQRARMCGFGDKDRRPITPPPCVRLVITDEATGQEVDLDDFPGDPSFFVLQVDLWAESADREANVVRASSNSPAVSISSATTTSYPPPAEHPRHMAPEQPMMYIDQHGQAVYANMPGYAVAMGRPGMMPQQQYGGALYYPQMPGQPMPFIQPPQAPSAMYTRNLIGSLTVNAAKLKDNEGKQGYWFVLQDLSVRTEGFFRLRMSFIDISNHGGPGVSRGKAPVLAWTFSEKFQVYSAKKFPGVIESTPLSKVFAQQGIKIPIRKDNKNEGGDDDDGD